MTLPEVLRFEIEPGQPVQLILRSGQTLYGDVTEVDLIADVIWLDDWAVRISEIAGVKVVSRVA